MAEMLVQDTSLQATAESIKDKLGITNPIEWVAGKGFADVIATLDKFPGGITAMTGGDFTPDSNTEVLIIPHDLGAEANFAIAYRKTGTSGIRFAMTIRGNFIASGSGDPIGQINFWLSRTSNTDVTRESYAQQGDWTQNVYMWCPSTILNDEFVGGVTYCWVAGVIENFLGDVPL